MTSLAQRLQKVQVATTEAKPDLSHMSLQEMKDQKISFGKTHHGRTFQDMCDNEQSWTTWFVQRYSNSGKAEHMVFLKFVELMVERAELTGQGVPLTNQKEVEKTRSLTGAQASQPEVNHGARAKAKAMVTVPIQTSLWDYEDDPETFEMLSETAPIQENVKIMNLESRMQGVETALASILQHLEAMNPTMATPQ